MGGMGGGLKSSSMQRTMHNFKISEIWLKKFRHSHQSRACRAAAAGFRFAPSLFLTWMKLMHMSDRAEIFTADSRHIVLNSERWRSKFNG